METIMYFSGVRPTGSIHIGNYLGAIKNWINLPGHGNLFCIVDQHALTTEQDAKNLQNNSLITAAAYLACGVDVKKDFIFMQSHVSGHVQLAWYLSCITPLGWLNRMTQFKDKTASNQGKANLGLYAYPVLMAADILLYGATHIPVGDDQKQHVELARDIAQCFNNFCQQDLLKIPEPVINKNTARIMSLKDGKKKMGKSDPSDYARIHLLDSDDLIVSKIKKAKTDSDLLPNDPENLAKRPEAHNLLTIYGALHQIDLNNACQLFAGKSFSDLKKILTDSLIAHIEPIRSKMLNLLDNRDYLFKVLTNGSNHARNLSEKQMEKIHQALGFLTVPTHK